MVLKLDRQMPTNDPHKNIRILKIDDVHKCNTLGIVNEMSATDVLLYSETILR